MNFYDLTSSFTTSVVRVLLISTLKDKLLRRQYYKFFLVSSFLKAVFRPKHLIVDVNSFLQLVQLHVEIRMSLLLFPYPYGVLDVIFIFGFLIVVLVLIFCEHTNLL